MLWPSLDLLHRGKADLKGAITFYSNEKKRKKEKNEQKLSLSYFPDVI